MWMPASVRYGRWSRDELVSPEFDASVLLPLARAGTLICGWTFRAACHNGLPITRTQVSFPAFLNVRVHVLLMTHVQCCNESLHAALHAHDAFPTATHGIRAAFLACCPLSQPPPAPLVAPLSAKVAKVEEKPPPARWSQDEVAYESSDYVKQVKHICVCAQEHTHLLPVYSHALRHSSRGASRLTLLVYLRCTPERRGGCKNYQCGVRRRRSHDQASSSLA